jgi:hypothetical protein
VRIPTASATREMAFCHPLRPTPKFRFAETDYSVVVSNWGFSPNSWKWEIYRPGVLDRAIFRPFSH